MRKITTSIAALSAAVLTATLAGSADAANGAFTDPDDTSHGSDLLSVTVKNRTNNLVITTKHVDLQADPMSGSGGAVYVDTDPADKGPEFVFVGGYFEGTDYQFLHTDGFGNKKWGEPADGFSILKLDFDSETVRMRISREALGDAGDVRVAVRVGGAAKSSVDWLGEPRTFTPWIAQG